MKKFASLLVLLAGCAVAFLCGAVRAAEPAQDETVNPVVVQALLDVTLDLTRYDSDYKKPLPVVKVVSQEWFAKWLCPGNAARRAICTAETLSGAGGAIGAFTVDGTIYIRNDKPLAMQVNILVHELTHFLQRASGWKDDFASCQEVAAHEVEAYTAQYLFARFYQNTPDGFKMPDFSCSVARDEPFGKISEPEIKKGDSK